MALSARLEIRQGQGLVITPQLQQAIKLLQMSSQELDAFVEGELERNPLLQRDEAESAPDEAPVEAASVEVAADSDARAELDTSHDDASPGERATGDAPEQAADAGGTVDWSRAGKGGSVCRAASRACSASARAASLVCHLVSKVRATKRFSGSTAWKARSARSAS